MKELIKGENITIERDKITISIVWESESDIDVDLSAFMLSSNKIKSIDDFIYFNNRKNLPIELRTQKNRADILIDLSNMDNSIDKIPIVATVDKEKDYTFEAIEFLKLSLKDIAYYVLDGVSEEKSVILAEVYRREKDWKFKIIASGFKDGLEAIARNYGLDTLLKDKKEREKKFKKEPNNQTNQDNQTDQENRDSKSKSSSKPNSSSNSNQNVKSQNSGNTFSQNKVKIKEKISKMKERLDGMRPIINKAIAEKYSESDTRMVLDRIFTDVLGYSINEIKTEQRIQGRRADYILSVGNSGEIVVEAKKAGMKLKEQQIFQATSYGAYSGIKWALLTNLVEWQLYYINSADKIEPELIFSIDLNNLEDKDYEMLFAISRDGIKNKNFLYRVRAKNRALSQANIISTLFTDDVLNKIRTTINKKSSYKVSNDEIQQALEQFLGI